MERSRHSPEPAGSPRRIGREEWNSGAAGRNCARRLAIDSASLYASDAANYAIVAFSLDGQNSRVVAGNHGEGSDGDGGPAASARIGQPAAMAVAGNRLFFSDATNLEIRQIDLQTGILSAVTGQPGASVDIALGLGTGLAARPDGSVLAQGSHRIWRIDPQTGSAMPFAGTGTDGVSGDGRPGRSRRLEEPRGAGSPSGNRRRRNCR